MPDASEYLKKLAEMGQIDMDRIERLLSHAFEKSAAPIITKMDVIRKALGMQLPFHKRVIMYLHEGVQKAKPAVATRLGLAATGIVATLGIAGAVKAMNRLNFNAAMKDLGKDPDIQADPKKAKSIANMVRRWAPSIAADSEVLKGTVKNMMKFPDSYLTFDIAKKLSEAEREYQATHGLLSLLRQRVI